MMQLRIVVRDVDEISDRVRPEFKPHRIARNADVWSGVEIWPVGPRDGLPGKSILPVNAANVLVFPQIKPLLSVNFVDV